MDKRLLHHIWTRIRPVKTWYLFAAFLLCAVVCVTSLRANYAGMVELRDVVYRADKNGGDVEAALQNLRAYVGQHMNTNLDAGKGVYPPIQLKYTYERLIKAEKKRIDAANSKIYNDAQRYCERQDPNSFYGRERVPCVQNYIKTRQTAKVHAVPDALYKFDFASPSWSPDLAGWSLVLSVLLLALTILRFILGRLLQHFTR
jgi:hypothetical protein